MTKTRGMVTMKILALNGSARIRGNTDILIARILKGGKKNGHRCEKLFLYDYEILPCIDCRDCKKGDYVCTLKDGMKKVYPKMEKADLIIFGTPNYWYGTTGKMKLLIDRMRPFVANGKLKGKRWVIVSPSAEGPKSCRLLVEMLRLSCDYLGMKFAGKVLAKAYEKGEIIKNQKALKKAYELGISL
jgi:multimeric flavodoxin WrbA